MSKLVCIILYFYFYFLNGGQIEVFCGQFGDRYLVFSMVGKGGLFQPGVEIDYLPTQIKISKVIVRPLTIS